MIKSQQQIEVFNLCKLNNYEETIEDNNWKKLKRK